MGTLYYIIIVALILAAVVGLIQYRKKAYGGAGASKPPQKGIIK